MITSFARAKINLYLHVVGKRADGYHLLDMLVVFAETGDSIAVAPAADLSLSIDRLVRLVVGRSREPDLEREQLRVSE